MPRVSSVTEFFYEPKHNLLVYKVDPEPAAILLRYLPEAKEFEGHVAVPRTFYSSQVLRWLKYPVLPVITDQNYEWPRPPHVEHPYASQKLTANFMVLERRGFNLSDMGTGKTLATLWAADWLMRRHEGFKAMIVAPLNIMESVWADGIFSAFLGNRSFEILHGSAAYREKALRRDADFYIINHDGVGVGAHTRKRIELDGFSKQLASRTDIKFVAIDEADAFKDASTDRWKLGYMVFGNAAYLWPMTGTPTPVAPTDAYGIAKLVNNCFGQSFTGFRLDTMEKISNFKWVPKRSGYEKARQLLSPSIRVDIKDVWDGPPLTYQNRMVELTDKQKTMMAQLKNQLQITTPEGLKILAQNEAAARNKFLQISQGAVYDEHHEPHLTDAQPRIDLAIEIMERAPSSVLMFVPLTSVVNLMYRVITEAGYKVEIVNGQTPKKQRPNIFKALQAGELDGIIADPGSVAHGVDLFHAQTVFWYGPTDKPGHYAQGNKRAHRPGQKFPVTVINAVSNKLEREVFRRLANSLSLQGALLDTIRKGEL